ncbi:MAG: hypothetical protein ACI9JM_000602 [Halioglobus sp.]|jgi:hypothetical protein
MSDTIIYIPFLFIGTLLVTELGFYLSRAGHRKQKPTSSVLNGSLFALLGLLIAFSFNGASSRFDARRAMVVDESIAVMQAWENLQWFAPEVQPPLREKFKEYVTSRIVIYELVPDTEKAFAALAASRVIKKELGMLVDEAMLNADDRYIRGLVAPAFAALSRTEHLRYASLKMHPPPIIFYMLIGITMIVAFLSAIETEEGRARPFLSTIIFATVISAVVYCILDIEYPRDGLIIADGQDYLMQEALDSFP